VAFLVERRSVKEIAMLKEIDRIAQGMLFLHGHVVHTDERMAARGRTAEKKPSRGRGRLSRVAAVCIATLPARLVAAQLR
jgi:hypothetical protein